jgi:hypothetical protein
VSNEDVVQKSRAADLIYVAVILVSAFFIYDLVLNSKDFVLDRAYKSAIIYAAETNRKLSDVICEYKSDMEGKTACNIIFSGNVETVDCVTGFYHFVLKSEQTCYSRGTVYAR